MEKDELETLFINTLTSISQMTNPNNPDNYRNDDPQGCLDSVYNEVEEALKKLFKKES